MPDVMAPIYAPAGNVWTAAVSLPAAQGSLWRVATASTDTSGTTRAARFITLDNLDSAGEVLLAIGSRSVRVPPYSRQTVPIGGTSMIFATVTRDTPQLALHTDNPGIPDLIGQYNVGVATTPGAAGLAANELIVQGNVPILNAGGPSAGLALYGATKAFAAAGTYSDILVQPPDALTGNSLSPAESAGGFFAVYEDDGSTQVAILNGTWTAFFDRSSQTTTFSFAPQQGSGAVARAGTIRIGASMSAVGSASWVAPLTVSARR